MRLSSSGIAAAIFYKACVRSKRRHSARRSPPYSMRDYLWAVRAVCIMALLPLIFLPLFCLAVLFIPALLVMTRMPISSRAERKAAARSIDANTASVR